MRLTSDHDDEFGALRQELLDEFESWVAERGAADPAELVGDAGMFLDWRFRHSTGSLDDLAEHDIREFLLDWCPRHFSAPAAASRAVCDAVAAFVDFLGRTGRLAGGVKPATQLMVVAASLVTAMHAAMDNPANYGMSKTLLADIEGADSMAEGDLLAALQARIDEHNALPLAQRKALTDHVFERHAGEPTAKQIELPFVHVPPALVEVEAAVARAQLPAKIESLREYLGVAGKPLTSKGNLKLADGRALVDLLDTGDEIDPKIGATTYKTQSTAKLRYLMYFIAVAEESGAVRVHKDRLVPVKAWDRNAAVDKATTLFRTVVDYGPLSMLGGYTSFFDELYGLLDDGIVHWLSGLLPPGVHVPFEDILELAETVAVAQFGDSELSSFATSRYLDQDISWIFQVLAMTGAITWTDQVRQVSKWDRAYPVGGRFAVTAFGRHVLPDYLPEAGYLLRTAENLADVDLPALVEAMGSIPEQQHSSVLAAWRPALSESERADLVAGLTGNAADARTRLIGMRLLGMFDEDVAEPFMRQLLDTPAAGHAAIWLLDHGLAAGETVGGFITPAVMVDILSLLLEHPEVLCEQFLAGHDPDRMLEFVWRHPAAETAALLDTLGEHLPDRQLAKAARKAAIKHRSWMANRD